MRNISWISVNVTHQQKGSVQSHVTSIILFVSYLSFVPAWASAWANTVEYLVQVRKTGYSLNESMELTNTINVTNQQKWSVQSHIISATLSITSETAWAAAWANTIEYLVQIRKALEIHQSHRINQLNRQTQCNSKPPSLLRKRKGILRSFKDQMTQYATDLKSFHYSICTLWLAPKYATNFALIIQFVDHQRSQRPQNLTCMIVLRQR